MSNVTILKRESTVPEDAPPSDTPVAETALAEVLQTGHAGARDMYKPVGGEVLADLTSPYLTALRGGADAIGADCAKACLALGAEVAAAFDAFTAREKALRGQPWWDKPSAVITHPYPDPGVTAFNEEAFAGTEAPAAAPVPEPEPSEPASLADALKASLVTAREAAVAREAAAAVSAAASPPAAEPETPDPAPTAVIPVTDAPTEAVPVVTEDGGESNG